MYTISFFCLKESLCRQISVRVKISLEVAFGMFWVTLIQFGPLVKEYVVEVPLILKEMLFLWDSLF